ncbi:MAG: pyridoxamine 5'-phosphate oxidase family protein [Acidimicrobiales bacterium]|nr:pyridoxamine 5'-phosphate oxidase family protein [Acidimicrobiales bacterium]
MSSPTSGPHLSDLAMRIAYRRGELGLSREEVARRAGMDAGYLDYFERRPIGVLSIAALYRLASALETTPEALAGGDVGRPPGPGQAGPQPVVEILTREQCEDYLLPGGIGRVVFSAARGPVALPVNFRFVEGRIVFRTEASASATLTTGEPVGFEVDRIDEAMSEGWSVLVSGHAQSVEEPEELEILVSAGIDPWAGGDREAFVRITIDEISGRSIRQGPVTGHEH